MTIYITKFSLLNNACIMLFISMNLTMFLFALNQWRFKMIDFFIWIDGFSLFINSGSIHRNILLIILHILAWQWREFEQPLLCLVFILLLLTRYWLLLLLHWQIFLLNVLFILLTWINSFPLHISSISSWYCSILIISWFLNKICSSWLKHILSCLFILLYDLNFCFIVLCIV